MHKIKKQMKLSILLALMLAILISINVFASTTTTRLSGNDRYETSSKIALDGWKQSDYAILALGEDYPDALCSAPLAGKYNAPILLTQKNSIPSSTLNVIKQLGVKNIFIIGGTGVVSTAVEEQLTSLGISITRLFGQNRYETDIAVAKQLGNISQIAVVTGEDYADALSIAPVAVKLNMPIILIGHDSVPQVVKDYILSKNITKSYVIGKGSSIINIDGLPNVTEINAQDKYSRNIAIINAFKINLSFSSFYLATGENFADALSGSVVAGLQGNPVMLTGSDITNQKNLLQSVASNANIKILGGIGAVSEDKVNGIIGNTSNAVDTTKTGQLKVSYIDVGQGDSILIEQGSSSMLIDAGTNDSTNSLVSYLQSQNIKKLDYLVLTHPHEDHIGGADAVIKGFDIGNIYMPKVSSTTKTFKDVVTAMSSKGLKATLPELGSTFKLGDANCTILSPINPKSDDLNTYSIVIKVVFGNNGFLFTGDAQTSNEEDMIKAGYDPSADVLKVGHHGSHTSTSQAFLDKVNPKYAVISLRKDNDYGHPHKEVMTRLQAKNIEVYRTDENDTIIATSDGNNIKFNTNVGSYKSNATGSSSSSTSNGATTPTPTLIPTPTPTPKPTPTPIITTPSENQSVTVYTTKTGSKYHLDGCSSLSKSKIAISLSDAKAKGLTACGLCHPPQ